MITGDEIRRARERAGMTQEQLGAAVGVSLRTVGNWERGAHVPRNRAAVVEDVLRGHVDSEAPPPLRGVSDVELLAEVARRMARGQDREQAMGNAQHPAPIGPITARGLPAPEELEPGPTPQP